MTPDPVFDTLARFTPAGPDPAALLFAAGRASARTPVGWKLAAGGLGLATAVLLGVLAFGDRQPAAAPPAETVTVPVIVPVPVPEPAPAASPAAPAPLSPWSVGALMRSADPDQLPRTEPVPAGPPPRMPLTPSDGRRGDLD